jgi:AcrR family transcriptional regulator
MCDKGRIDLDTTNFDRLSDEKRLSIINAGILCFGRNGYKKASIADIAAEAKISKAAIFHYFGTKKDLYLYLFDYAFSELLAGQTEGTDDFFECLEAEIQNRIRINAKHPGMYDFLLLQTRKIGYEDIEELSRLESEIIERSRAILFAKVDWCRFREGCDRETALNMATWVITGCLSQCSEAMTEAEVYSEVKRYSAILKKAMYKPEYL